MKPYRNSSALSRLVKVEQKTGASDRYGNPVWETFFEAYAQVSDRIGSETLINSQEKRVSTAKTTFIFRANQQSEAITPTMRIVWHGFVHEIISGPIFSDDRNFVTIEAVRRY